MGNPEHDVDLDARQRAEAAFHDHKYATGDSFPRHYKINPTYPVFERMLGMLGDVSDKHVLEYGCGSGWITLTLARRGARVSAFDISPEAVAQTREALRAENLLDRCDVRVMGGERLEFEDGRFDMSIGFAILHHLSLTPALRELHRVLRPGGVALFGEPLGSNPIINMYRRATPQFRTADEVPIDLDALSTELSTFRRFEHHPQLLLATGASAMCYIPGLARLAPHAQRWLVRLDDLVLNLVPGSGRWAWYSILRLEK